MDGRGVGAADAVQIQVHRRQPRDAGDDVVAGEAFLPHAAGGGAVARLGLAAHVFVSGEQESGGAAGGVADGLPRPRVHHIDASLDDGARGEILAGAGFGVGGGALQQAFVDRALHVGAEGGPGLGADHAHQRCRWAGSSMVLFARV